MKKEVKKLLLEKSKIDELNSILKLTEKHPDFKDATVIEQFTVKFSNNLEADIKVVNGDGPYLDPVLFEDGYEVQCLQDPSDSIEGEYFFEYKNKQYVVVIEEK